MPRKQHPYHFIYKTTCKVNGNFYIGMHSTSNLEDGYIGSGKRLWYSILKHGRENHSMEILEMLPNRSSLKKREKEIVNENLMKDPRCMNLKHGGEGGTDGLSEEIVQKIISAMNAAKWSNELNREIASKRMTEMNKSRKNSHGSFSGKTHSDEVKNSISKKNSLNQSGDKNSQFGKCWIQNGKETKSIHKFDLSNYIENGWKLGRLLKQTLWNWER